MPNDTTTSETHRNPVLEMRGICKSYPGVRALDQASLSIVAGEVHALMGENGAGKSTLMKTLAGAQSADTGEILLDGKAVRVDSPQTAIDLGINIIYQELNLVPHISVAENIFLGREPRIAPGVIHWSKMNRQAQELMDGLGVRVNVKTEVRQLSLAQRQMVEIAKATSKKSRVIAMDEPSATLTDHELEHLFSLIKHLTSEGIAIIYISHRMEEVFQIANSITIMRDGKTVSANRIRDISREDVLRQMVGRDLDESFPKVPAEVGAPVLQVNGLNRKGVLHDITFDVKKGEVVALAGLVGSGRTEIARCIFGADRWSSGHMLMSGKTLVPKSPTDAINAGIGFVTEDRKDQGVILKMKIRENVSLASMRAVSRFGMVRERRESDNAVAIVKRLRIRTPSPEQLVGNLSGGNQQKVVIGKWLQTPLKLLILDEPTRGIDVGAKREIYHIMNELAKEGVAILMISSELPEVLGMADRVIVIREGRIAGELSRAEATQEKVGRLALAD